MKKIIIGTLIGAGLAGSASAQRYYTPDTPSIKGVALGLTGGYATGLGGEVFVHAPNVAGPIGVKLSAAYTRPSDSIRDDVSINSTLGLPTFGAAKSTLGASESGSHTTFGLDGTYSLGEVAPGLSALAYAGGRYGIFSATESYSLSNSATTYSMNAFGVGAGAQLSYALAGNISLVGDLGIDQYFNGGITASGASSDSWSTGEAGYNDVRNRLAFPGTVLKAKLGVKFTF